MTPRILVSPASRDVPRRSDRQRHTEQVAALARTQDGRVRRDQLIAIGMPETQVDSWVKRKRLILVHRSVYAVGHEAESRRADWQAATLVGGDNAVLSHLPGLVHLGFVTVPVADAHVTIPKQRRRRAGIVWHRDRIEPDERMEVRGIPVTCVTRAFRDSSPLLTRDQLERALEEADWALRQDPVTFAELFQRYPRHPGCRVLKAVFADRSEGKTRSWLERRFKPLSRRLEHRPLWNHRITLADRVIEADCLWPLHMLIVELDGRTHRERVAAFESDRARDRAAALAGYLTVRITWRQLRDDPEKVLADIAAILAARTPSA